MTTHVFDATPAIGPRAFAEMRVWLREWQQTRRTRARIARELASYTDRELADLGLTREDIPAVLRGTYRR